MRNRYNRLIQTLSVLLLVSFLAVQAHAAIWVVGNSYAIESGGSLEDSITSTEFDIIVIDSQTQLNRTVSPASGAGQTDYDNFLGTTSGADSTDPTFTAGSPPYLDHDGGDYQTMASGSTQTTFQKNLHKTTGGQAFTICIVYRTPSAFAAERLWGNISAGVGGEEGLTVQVLGSGIVRITQRGASDAGFWSLGSALSVSTDNLICIAADFTNDAATVTHWINTATGTDDTDDTAGTGTTDPILDWNVGASAGGIQPLKNGSRIYHYFSFNEVISDATMATAKTIVEAELGISF